MRIYLDHNAGAPLDPRVADALAEAARAGAGNPSSVHAEGRAARDRVEQARRQVAALVGGAADEVVFTSGGSEADLLGIVGLARAAVALGRPRRVLAAAIEHPAVAGAVALLEGEGFAAVRLPVDGEGVVAPEGVAAALAEGGAAVVAVALANHELGTLQEIPAIAAAAHAAGALLHCDAVQAAGKLPLDAAARGADALALSAHKLGGPAGAGALWVRRGIDLPPVWPGGHQERGRRPGTENLLGAIGLGVAAALAQGEGLAAQPRVAALRDRLERGLRALPEVRIHGAGAPRVANTVNAGFAGALGEALVTALDLAGVAVSTGAACTSGTVAPSPVLLAIGQVPARAVEAVRFSLGRSTTEAEIDRVLALLPAILERARRFR